VTAVAAPGRGYQLQVGSADALAVSVVMFPQQSVLALLRQLASAQPNGGPGWPRATIGRALRPAARFAAQSFTSRAPIIPECCAPIPPLADVPVTEQADRLRDLPPDVLTDELQTWCDSHTLPRQWQAAAEQPRRWLASLADASLDAWAAMQPRWRAAAPLLDREVARVGTAAVRGGMAALLNCLHPRVSYADGVLALSFPRDRCVDLGGRRLALMPMIADRGALAVSFERPGACYIGYPIRPPAPGVQAAANGTLALILGPLRAAALQVLHHPLTVNELAAAVHCAPTTATYHLQQLATASLVTRERHGTSVRVSRTTRGDKLIDLLSDLSGFSTRPVAPVTSTGGTRLRVMGTYVDPHGVMHGFLGRPGPLHHDQPPARRYQKGQGTGLGFVNDHGVVSGSYLDSHGNDFSFIGHPGRLTPVNDPHAPPFSNSGLITGAYLDTHDVFHGFLDEHGEFTPVNDPAGARGTAAEALSNTGVIVGFCTDTHGSNHGFTFTQHGRAAANSRYAPGRQTRHGPTRVFGGATRTAANWITLTELALVQARERAYSDVLHT